MSSPLAGRDGGSGGGGGGGQGVANHIELQQRCCIPCHAHATQRHGHGHAMPCHAMPCHAIARAIHHPFRPLTVPLAAVRARAAPGSTGLQAYIPLGSPLFHVR